MSSWSYSSNDDFYVKLECVRIYVKALGGIELVTLLFDRSWEGYSKGTWDTWETWEELYLFFLLLSLLITFIDLYNIPYLTVKI